MVESRVPPQYESVMNKEQTIYQSLHLEHFVITCKNEVGGTLGHLVVVICGVCLSGNEQM